jgi:carbon-monoxide dehydrogenase medium subunit
MIPATFDYDRATSLDEALDLLARHGAEGKLIAGGQSLLPLMKLRLARPERLIDIGRVADLRGVRELAGGGLAIGALTTYADLLEHPFVGRFGVFSDALPRIGDVQVRNRGTIGGSIAHADPAADLPAVLLALDAVVVARSSARGEREIAIAALFEGAFTTTLAEDELITEIRLPAPSGTVGSAYQALEQQASGYPIAGVAAAVGRAASRGGAGEPGAWDLVRIAITGVGEHPYRAAAAEAALAGTRGDDPAVATALAHVTDGIDVNGDIHADPEYRAAMARVMAKRAIELARARLG